MYKQRISYAKNHEDVRAWRTLRELGVNSDAVFYVELGASDPWVDSNTAYFYTQGAHGLLVEADSSLMSEIVNQRPNDLAVNAFVSDKDDGLVKFFRSSSTGLSTGIDDFKRLGEDQGFKFKATDIESVTVKSLIARQKISDVHFMSIDIEGNEMKALKGIDFNHLRPWIICVEMIKPGSNEVVNDGKTDFLLSNGYSVATFDGVNKWFLANEFKHVSETLAVPFSSVDKEVFGWVSHNELEFYRRRQEIRRGTKRFDVSDAPRIESIPDQNKTDREVSHIATKIRDNEHVGYVENESWAFSLNRDQERSLKFHSNAVQSRFDSFTPAAFHNLPSKEWIKEFTIGNLPLLLDSDGDQKFSEYTVKDINLWIAKHSLSGDTDLENRLDSGGDRWGTYIANSIAYDWFLTRNPSEEFSIVKIELGISVLFDVTSLQNSSYAERGIGRYAKEIFGELLGSADVRNIKLFQDPLLGKVPEWILHNKKVSKETPARDEIFDLFVSPSPMTLEPWQLMLGLKMCTYSAAYVYDFIPAKYNTHYLPNEIDRLRYQAQVRALKEFDKVSAISNSTRTDLAKLINLNEDFIEIAWPSHLSSRVNLDNNLDVPERYVTVFGGNESRKNLFVGLAAWGAATAYLESRPVAFVIGYNGNQELIDEVAISAGLRPGEAVVLPFLTDSEFKQVLSGSLLSIVPSLEEGLSLPVIESLAQSVPVAASNIEAHVELCGKSKAFGDPRSVEDFARAISYTLKNRNKVLVNQSKKIRQHKHSYISNTVTKAIASSKTHLPKRKPAETYEDTKVGASDDSKSKRLSVGVVTPWPEQHTGVADYSKVTLEELSKYCDVTIYTDAKSPESGKSNIKFLPTSDALQAQRSHDFVINVIGNSHFHIPSLWNLRLNGGLAICHDSRMFEFYLALIGASRLEKFLGYDSDTTDLVRELETCSYRNVAFGELVHYSQGMFMHSNKSLSRVEEENAIKVNSLPFVPMRVFSDSSLKKGIENESVDTPRISEDVIRVSSFGSLDERTKRESVVVDACQLLRLWGIPIELTFVGDCSNVKCKSDLSLSLSASQTDLSWIHLLGRVDEETMIEQMKSSQVIVQLRSGPHFTTSGPVIDAIGLGKLVVASSNLVDEEYPSFVVGCHENVSALELAETIKNLRGNFDVFAQLNDEVKEFSSRFNAENYSNELFSKLMDMR